MDYFGRIIGQKWTDGAGTTTTLAKPTPMTADEREE